MKAYRSLFFIIVTILFAGYAFATESGILTEEVGYYDKSDKVRGYLARPEGNQKHPALILIHEWWGLNDYMRQNAEIFAKLGYVALAVDLYGGKSTTIPDEARALATGVRQNVQSAFDNLKSAVSYLKSRPDVDSARLAAIGWCFGGGWSYQIAKNNLGVKASIIYYGFFNPKDDLSKMRATILGHFGKDDGYIKVDNVNEFQAKLKTLNGDHEIYIYENAGHGFANSGGGMYNKAAAELAWDRTVVFLNKYL